MEERVRERESAMDKTFSGHCGNKAITPEADRTFRADLRQ